MSEDLRARCIEAGRDAMGRNDGWRWWHPRHLERLFDLWEPLIRADEKDDARAVYAGMLEEADTLNDYYQSAIEELVDALADVINQACSGAEDGDLDSMALSAYADAMRLLAKRGRIRITEEYGRRVIAEWETTTDG